MAKETTEAVLKHHMQALASGDLDGMMKNYTSDSVVFSPGGTFKGLESIRAMFKATLGALTPIMANLKVIKQDIDGEYAYLLWSALPAVPFAGNTFRVHNGKILLQSLVAQPSS